MLLIRLVKKEIKLGNAFDLIVVLSLISILPLLAVICTSFLKISVVLLFLRESLALQQNPPNIVIYGIAIILAVYTMGPVCNNLNNSLTQITAIRTNGSGNVSSDLLKVAGSIAEPLKIFLEKNTSKDNQKYFYDNLTRLWGNSPSGSVDKHDFLVLVPSFMLTQLNEAFKIGFLLYLPSLIIDVFISNLLLALGMMMMSPMTISTPIKLILFITIGGWQKVIDLLLHSFSV